MDRPLLFQAYEWYLKADHDHYKSLQALTPHLKNMGFTAIWLPPFYKATSPFDVGYGIYDLYDLGEFDQLGQVKTKYGSREELEALIQTITEHGLLPVADVVINHKAGADFSERFLATPVNPDNREEPIGEEREIEAWTGFRYPGRAGKYSEFVWHYFHFSGVDYDNISQESGVYKISGHYKDWSEGVSSEHGNFDYLMFADIDHHHPDVVEELNRWMDWLLESLPLRGLRLDALKHIDTGFMSHFLTRLDGRELLLIGEYWENDTDTLIHYIDQMGHRVILFDVPLHFKFYEASIRGADFDLRTIKDNTLVERMPTHAVTFVDNHDSQPGQSLASFVEDGFKIQAYTFILLRQDGFPCVFYGDYLGIDGEYARDSHQWMIDKLLEIRRDHAAGEQHDYFEHPNCIGWLLTGDEHHTPLAVLISNGAGNEISMLVGEHLSGRAFVDYTGHQEGEVFIGDDGRGVFYVGDASVSIWGLSE